MQKRIFEVEKVFALSTVVAPEVFYYKAVTKNFANFTGKHLCLVADLKSVNAFKKRLQRRCFLGFVAEFIRIPILLIICSILLACLSFFV